MPVHDRGVIAAAQHGHAFEAELLDGLRHDGYRLLVVAGVARVRLDVGYVHLTCDSSVHTGTPLEKIESSGGLALVRGGGGRSPRNPHHLHERGVF